MERILSERDIGKKEFYDRIRDLLSRELKSLSADMNLIANRYNRFRSIGTDAINKESI